MERSPMTCKFHSLHSLKVTEFTEFPGQNEFRIAFIFERTQFPSKTEDPWFLISFDTIYREHIFVLIVSWFKESDWFRIINELRSIFIDRFSSWRIGNFNRCRRFNRIRRRNSGYRCNISICMFRILKFSRKSFYLCRYTVEHLKQLQKFHWLLRGLWNSSIFITLLASQISINHWI